MKTIFATILHRRSVFYEEGMQKFLDAGYPLYLYVTVEDKGFGNFGLVHPLIKQFDSPHGNSFDMAMEDFKLILDKEEWDTVVFVDSDTFFENIDYAEKLIKQFNESNFGFCSYLENVFDYKPEYVFSGAIAEVNDQYFEEVDQPPYTFKPIPHYENAFMMIKRKVWDNLRIQCFINTRELVKGIFEAKAKIGIHYRDKKLVYSHKGNGWFHVGALTKYYYMMENGDLSQLDPDSEIDKARIGYFVAQRERYGREIYADHINENVTKAAEIFGGEGIVKLAWVNLSEMLL